LRQYWRNEFVKEIESGEGLLPSPSFPLVKEPDPSLIPVLVDLLQDKDGPVRLVAARCLCYLEKQASPAVPPLARALTDPSVAVRRAVVETLGRIGPDARASVPPLTQALRDPDWEVRILAAQALWRIARNDTTSIDTLVEVINGNGPADKGWKQMLAAEVLGEIGPPAKRAVGPLVEVLAERKWNSMGLRSTAAEALGKIGPAAKEAIPALVLSLKDDKALVRVRAAIAIWRIDRQPKMAAPVLIEVLQSTDHDAFLRGVAARGLGEMGVAGKQAIPALIATLKGEDSDLRGEALRALGCMGPAAAHALPIIRQALSEDRHYVRICAAEALWKLGAEPDEPVRVLVKALADEDYVENVMEPNVRIHAARILKEMKDKAKSSVPALRAVVATTSNRKLREAATQALEAIGAEPRSIRE
jgi:HEAT repeat protein